MKAFRLINPELEYLRYRQRARVAALVAAILLLVLFVRFFWLQVVQYDRYHALAENNRIALLPAPPARGVIYDRGGTVLAQNFSAYTLEVTPDKTGGLERTLDDLAGIVEITDADRKRFQKLMAENKQFSSIPIRNRLTEEEVARFAAHRYRFPGVEVKARLFRQYPLGESLAHVVGYIGRVNAGDLENLAETGQEANYRGTDHIGKAGVEASYEYWLHGRTGLEKVENDSGGRAVRVLSRTPPTAGYNLYLHIDTRLQQLAEQAFGDYRGALVALDPRNGGVLALVSQPGFDPNLFIDGIDVANWKALNESPDHPLINRALRGIYPPGSTIKPFMALAGLHYGLRRPGDSIVDPGYYSLPGSSHRYRDWKKDGHGWVDLKRSVVISCDTYYYQLAHQMGIERMHDFLARFGFGRRTGIDLDGELAGLLPSPEWKRKRFKQPWWPGETVIAGIGQGYTLATPLQLAVATMAIANDGVVYKPRLIRAWREPGSGRIVQAAPQVMDRIPFKPAHLAIVKQAMVEVTHPGGTASAAGAGAPYPFAGKTGTAQVVGIKQGARYDERRVAARHRDHALFIAFAPADNPKIVVAVMVENGGHGGSTAAPMARKVIDYWLLGKLPPPAGAGPVTDSVVPEEEQEGEDRGPVEEPVPAQDASAGPPSTRAAGGQ
ncbi:MAG TPA: penicillin-binding protein 2 [Thiobacillaceae bacterium]|nr:penicillin-binding protein 2 [Thiobacillaceae bacterium]